MNKNIQNKPVSLEVIRNNRDIVINGRTAYFTELVKVAVELTTKLNNETNEDQKRLTEMLVTETITAMTSSWRNTLPFNILVSDAAATFAKSLGVDDLRNHDYSLKISMDTIIDQIEEPSFLSVAENLNDQDLAKLNKALAKDDKALNSNVMLHWDHAITGKMFINLVTELIEELSTTNADDVTISTRVAELVNQQAIVWILKTENYLLAEKGYKETRDPSWEDAFKDCSIELSDFSKQDYSLFFSKEW